MKTLLEHTDEHRLERDEMAYLAGSLFTAGSETVCPIQLTTTWIELTWFTARVRLASLT
jgi:hypothetical protein